MSRSSSGFGSRGWIGLVVLLLLSSAPARSSAQARLDTASTVIHVGAERDFLPYSFEDRYGRAAGFGPELIEAAGRAMGLRLQLSTGSWDDLWNQLVRGEIDALPVVARLPERIPLVDFSLPHTVTFDAFFVRRGRRPPADLASARGREIVVLRSDAAHHVLVERHFPGVIPVESIPEGLALVASGRHDAFLCSKVVGTLEMRQRHIRGLVAGPPIPDYKRSFCFAVRKGDADLVEKLNQGLLIIKTNGEYDRIYRRWLTAEDPWQRWEPYAGPAIAIMVLLVVTVIGLVLAVRWLARRRARELALASEEIRNEFAERVKAEEALRDANASLERRIAERTAELRAANLSLSESNLAALNLLDDAEASRDQAERANRRLQVLIENVNAGVALIDETGAFSLVNRQFLVLFGLAPDSDIKNVRDTNWAEWQVVDETGALLPVDEHPVRRAVLTGRAVRDQLVGVRVPGGSDQTWMLVSAEPLVAADGRIENVICTYTDISERRRAEAELARVRDLLAEGQRIAHAGTFEYVAETRTTVWSEEEYEIYGLDPAGPSPAYDVMLARCIHPDDAGLLDRTFRAALENRAIYELEHRIVRPDGTVRWVFDRAHPFFDSSGRLLRYVGATLDITERKQAAAQMADDLRAMTALQRLGTLFVQEGNLDPVLGEIVEAAIAISGADFGNIQLLDAASSQLRIVAQRGFPDWWVEFWQSVSEGQGVCGTALERGERVIVEDVERSPIFAGTPALEIQRRAGVRAVQSTPLVTRTGRPLGMFSTHFRVPHRPDERTLRLLDLLARQIADIVERAQNEAALRESEARFRLLAEAMPQIVWSADAAGTFDYYNPRAFEYAGVEPGNVAGWGWSTVMHPSDLAGTLARWKRSLETGEEYEIEQRLRRADGEYRWHLTRGLPLRDGNGRIRRWIGTATDIQERKAAEQELTKLNRTLRALSNSNQALLRAADEAEFLEAACRIVVEDCGHTMVWIGYAEDDEAKSVRPVATAGLDTGYLETLRITWADVERGRGPTGIAIRTGRPAACRNMLTDPAFEPWRAAALERGYASSIALPLLDDGRAFGAITIYSRQPDPFTEDEVVLLGELADDVAFGIRSMRVRAAHRQAEEALADSEARYRSLFRSMTEGFAVHEIETDDEGVPCDYRFLEVNPAFEQFTGLRRDDVVGRRMTEVLPGEDPLWVKVYGGVALSGEPVHFQHYAPVLRRHYEIFAYRPAPRQFAALFMDISDRVQGERLGEAINAVNEIIHATLDAGEVLSPVLASAATALGCDTAAISLHQDGEWVVRHVHGMPSEVVGTRMTEDDEPHAMLALQTGQPVAIDDGFNDPRGNTDRLRAWGIRSVLVVPIVTRHDRLGVVFFNYQTAACQFLDRHVDFAKKLAASLSLALENSRLYADVRYELEEKKQAEAALREAHARAAWLARLPEENPRPVARVAADGRILYANPESARPDVWALRTGEPVPAPLEALVTRALETGEIAQQDLELADRVYSVQVMPVASEDYANLYGLDITDRLAAEQALAEGERRFRLLFEGIQEAFLLHEIITDSAGEPVDLRYLEANPAAERQLGRSRAELIGRTRSEVEGPLDAEIVRIMRRAAAENRPAHFEQYEADACRWHEVLLYSPRPGQIASLNLDITDRKFAERMMEARSAATQALAGAADIEDAGAAVLEQLALLFDAAGGELWIVAPEDGCLRRVSGWHREGAASGEWIEAGEDLALAPGEGVPGRAWLEGRTIWLEDASEFPTAPRAEIFERLGVGGALGIPIRLGSHVLGAMTFGARRAPDERLLRAGEILGSQLAQFVRRRRAEAEVMRNSAVVTGMNRIFQATLAAVDEAELAGVCLAAAEEVTGARFGFVGEIDEETGCLDEIALSDPGCDAGRSGVAQGGRAVPRGFEVQGIYGRVLTDGKSLLTNDPGSHPDHVGLPQGHPSLESFLGAPLIREGKTIGVIAVGNRPGGFREEDRASLEALARATTEAFMRRRAELALARSTERFKLLSDVAGSLLAAPDPQPIVNDLCARVMAHLDCQVFFNFIDDPSGRLRLNACAGIDEEDVRRLQWLDYGVAVCGCVAEQGVRIVAEDIQHGADPRTDLVRSFGVQAYACHPLLAGDRVIGTLSFGTKKRTRFEPDELALMKTVADQVAVAMERIRTQREVTQLALDLQRRVSELQTFFDTAPIGLAIALDPEGRHIRGNRANEEMFGLPAGAELSQAADAPTAFRVFADGRELDVLELPMQRAVRGVTVVGQQFEVLRADGDRIAVYASSRPLFDENGRPRGAVGAFLDITALRRAEESVRESEERFRAVASSTPDHVLVQDRDLRYTLIVNPQLGLTEEEMIGRTDQDILPPEDAEALTRIKRRVLETGQPIPVESALTSKHGRRDFFEGVYIPRRDARGQVVGLIGYFRNVTERKHAEQDLRESEERYRALVEMSPEAVLVHQSGTIVYTNPACVALFGGKVPEDLIGTFILDRIHPDDRARVEGRIRIVRDGGSVPRREVRMLRLDGSEILAEGAAVRIEYRGEPAIQAIVRDVSERRKLEERLAQAQKMEAIGLLAGGVAHDFNNLLVGVIGNASLAQDMVAPGSKVKPFLDRIVRTGEQAAHLTRQLLAYAGKGQVVVEAVDLSQIARTGADLVRASIPSKITLHLDLAPGLPLVNADQSQMNQVFMNLVINAAEAIGSGPGRISVRTDVRELDVPELRTASGPELRPGRYVLLEVTDDGSGMDEDTLGRIFDPFFTTKFLGRGLGLAAVAGIVRTHGGGIQVESMPGKGSRFAVLLPALETAVAEEEVAEGGVRDLRGAGRILLVDDEDIVLELGQAALQRQGYDVLVAASGPAALRVFEREAAHVDLVILDLSMPGMGGEEVLPELKRIRPDVRVVISSGYTQDDAMKYFRGLPAVGFIQKPYTAARLAAEVKRALGEPGSV